MSDDHALVQRLRAGDEAAFAEIVDRYDRQLRRLARTFVRTDALADDVVGETWEAVIKGIDRFEERSSLKTWIFRILVNRARTRAVREARQVPFSSLETPDGPAVDASSFAPDGSWAETPEQLGVEPETHLLASELRGRLGEIVDTLPEQQRSVILLRDVAGLDGPEVAEALGISEGNQRVILHRARARVADQLRIRGLMRCRDCAELVTEYLDGALGAGEREAFEAHISTCAGCEVYFEQIRTTVITLGELPAAPADPAVRESLLAAFRALRGQ